MNPVKKSAPCRAALCLALALMLCGCMGDGNDAKSAEQLSASPSASASASEPGREDGTWAVIAKEFLSLRTRPDPSADRIKKLAPGALVRILGEEGDFAFVEEIATGETGYAMRKYLFGLPSDFAAPTPVPPRQPGRYRVEAEEFLSLRASPDTKADRLAVLDPGAEVEVLLFEGSFARAKDLASGLEGYVLASYLIPVEESSAPALPPAGVYTAPGDVYYVIAEQFLSLRVDPDASSERVAKLPRGERVSILGKEGDFALVEMEATGERGYVLSRLLADEATYAALPKSESPDARFVDAMEYLTLREAPSTAAPAVATLPRGESVTVVRREGDFAFITVDSSGQKGYVLDGYLSASRPAAQTSDLYTVLADEFISLRKDASSASERIAQIPAGAQVKVLAFDGAFAQVESGGERGYVLSGYVAPADKAAHMKSLAIVKPTAGYAPHKVGEDLAALAAQYPGKMRIASAGKSLGGRDIPVALLGSPSASRHILIQAGIHGREHMTALLAVAQIEDMLARPDATRGGKTYAQLLDEVCFHILPMVNPDGAAISQSAKATPALTAIYQSDVATGRFTGSIESYLRGWKANAAGVDINRNFNAGWANLNSAPGPSASHYKGETAHDQPETRALADYTKRYDFDATLSYHAYGSMLYWEYGSDQSVLDASRSLARAVRAVTRYPLAGSGGVDAGGYKDWAMEMRSIPSLTIEVGTRECPLPLDEFYSIWERNRDVLPAVALWVLE